MANSRNEGMGCAHMFAAAVLIFSVLVIVMMAMSVIKPSPPPQETPTTLSPAEQAREACRFLKVRYARTPLAQIPLEDADLIGNCKTLGLW